MAGHDVFAALADPTRRSLIQRLAEASPQTASRLAADLPITRQAVSKHLAVLAEAGLVTAERVGRETRYALTPAALAEAASWLSVIETMWDERLAALKRQVEGGEMTENDGMSGDVG